MCSKKYHATNDLVNSISCGNMSFQTEYDELNTVRSYLDSIRELVATNDESVIRYNIFSRCFNAYVEATQEYCDVCVSHWVRKVASFIMDKDNPLDMVSKYADDMIRILKL
tara:strand:+ start:11783 stop:12115 length:333 start_codon:yes stop_codon:yes gene_type:complete